MFQYMGTNTRLNRLFNKAMAQQTMMVISKLLERFKGFDGISVLVDVGGGTGATLEDDHFSVQAYQGNQFRPASCPL